MREGGRVRQWLRRLRAARREGAWLGASLVVAAATIVSVLAFGSYESGHREAALNAEAAQLAASKVNALEWQTIGEGRLAPLTDAQIRQLLGAIAHHLASISADRGAAGEAIGAYNSAIHAEFQPWRTVIPLLARTRATLSGPQPGAGTVWEGSHGQQCVARRTAAAQRRLP